MIRFLFVALAAFALAPAALACNSHPTLSALEGQIMCPVCGTTLDQSDSPAAHQIERVIAQYGEAILAAPPKKGFGLLAWWLPIAGIVIVGVLLAVGAWRWSRVRADRPALDPSSNGRGTLDPAVERRVDEELARFDG